MPKNSKKLHNKNYIRFKPLVIDLKRRFSEELSNFENQKNDQTQKLLIVSISDQKLYLLNKHEIEKSYSISTATAGIGNQSGSFQTPLGIHRVTEKIGSKAPSGSIFKERKNTHQIAEIILDSDIKSTNDNITSRILRLEGLENGYNKGFDKDSHNVDSFSRYIYIHGTDEEGKLGKPASHGCVRMANQDIIELFDKVETGYFVLIIKY